MSYGTVKPFARSGWRLTVPGGPAGGHYKGFTHNVSAGTDIPPTDQYEQDREDGMASHDTASASPRNPRGVYRSPGEVPPRPNASGQMMSFRSFQTARHAGTSVAPGSFPAEYTDTTEDDFLPPAGAPGLGAIVLGPGVTRECPAWGCGGPGLVERIYRAGNGATNKVSQPVYSAQVTPPAQSVAVSTVQPVSPTPAPIVATNEVIPLNDGSGNYVNISTGAIVPGSSIAQNPATGQLTTSAASSGALNWLEQNTIFSAIPNWGVLAAAAFGVLMLSKGHR